MTEKAGTRRVYMDYAAASPVDPRVVEAMAPYLSEEFGNPSSIHSSGRGPRKAVEEARASVARLVNASRKEEVIFTSGGTEGNNLAIKGLAMRTKGKGRHIVTSSVEHISVLNIMKYMEKNGFEVTYVAPGPDGIVSPGSVEEALREDTVLVSIMHSNNEIGTLQPVDEIGEVLSGRGVAFHVDAVASSGRTPIDVQAMHADLVTVSSNDMYGPRGMGALYVRDGTKLEAVEQGGGQERGIRSGSENVPGIVGFGAAADAASREMPAEGERLTGLRDRLVKGVLGNVEDAFLNGHPEKRLPNNANFRFRYVEGESLLLNLDIVGISASSSSPCTSKSLLPSHVLLACDVPTEEAQSALQFTMGRWTSDGDIDMVLEVLPGIVKKLRAMSPFSPENLAEMRSTAGHRPHGH
jgi:cysteine desulfurase